MRSTAALTPTQRSVLETLRTHITVTGFMPTRAEIAEKFGWKSANAAEEHLRAMERKGVIEVIRGVQRGIRITDSGLKALDVAPASPFYGLGTQFIALPVVDPSKVRYHALARRALA